MSALPTGMGGLQSASAQTQQPAAAAETDWPQILGPNRDGQVTLSRRIGSAWQSPLPVRWRVALGSGYGGAAVIGNQVLTLHRQEDQEMLQSVSLVDGSLQWQAAWPARYRGRINPDEGPRCVPVIHDGRAFCFGAAGELVCVDIGSGQILWRRDLHQEYQADAGYFGAGSTPLAIDGMLIVCLGGKQAGVVAVEQKTGNTLWTATDYEASYASPIAIRTADSSLVLVVMQRPQRPCASQPFRDRIARKDFVKCRTCPNDCKVIVLHQNFGNQGAGVVF